MKSEFVALSPQIMDMSTSECFGCGRSGHWIKNCPNAGRGRGRGRGRGKGRASPVI